MIDKETLHIVFSTNAQLLGALVALVAAFVHFRITRMQDYLIGDGQSIYNNWNRGEYNSVFDNRIDPSVLNRLKLRLEDGITRKNVFEIKDVLVNINKHLSDGNYPNERNNLRYIIEDWFLGTEQKIKRLKSYTIFVSGLSIFTIILSIFLLVFSDTISKCYCLSAKALFFDSIFTITILIFTFYVIYLGLADDTKHESDTVNPL